MDRGSAMGLECSGRKWGSESIILFTIIELGELVIFSKL